MLNKGVCLIKTNAHNLFSLSPVYTCNGRPLECCLDHGMADEREADVEKMTQEQLEVGIIST